MPKIALIQIATVPGLIASGPVIVYMNVDRWKRKWAWRCCCFSGPTSTTTTSARPRCVKVASVYDDANEVRPILALLHVKYCPNIKILPILDLIFNRNPHVTANVS